jgi:hypothetical protein
MATNDFYSGLTFYFILEQIFALNDQLFLLCVETQEMDTAYDAFSL